MGIKIVEYISFSKSSFFCLIICFFIFYLKLESNSYKKYNIEILEETKDYIIKIYDSYIPVQIKKFNEENFVKFYTSYKENDFVIRTEVESLLGIGEKEDLSKNKYRYKATNGKTLIIIYTEHGTIENWEWKE